MQQALQQALRHAFRNRSGCAAVLDLEGAETLAIWRPDIAKSWQFAPGSVLKPFLLAEILQGPVQHLACPGDLRIAGLNLACTHPRLAEPLGPDEALALSCNSWFAAHVARMGPERLASALRSLAIPVPAESTIDDLKLIALGLRGARVTCLGLARGFRMLALRKSAGDKGLEPLWTGLKWAVERGTGRNAGSGVWGKTGTTREAACFAGFNGRIVAAVAVPGGTGGGDAAPIAGEIFHACRAGC